MSFSLITDPQEFIGLSTDEKPVEETTPGSTFYETDTGDTYIFDGTVWIAK